MYVLAVLLGLFVSVTVSTQVFNVKTKQESYAQHNKKTVIYCLRNETVCKSSAAEPLTNRSEKDFYCIFGEYVTQEISLPVFVTGHYLLIMKIIPTALSSRTHLVLNKHHSILLNYRHKNQTTVYPWYSKSVGFNVCNDRFWFKNETSIVDDHHVPAKLIYEGVASNLAMMETLLLKVAGPRDYPQYFDLTDYDGDELFDCTKAQNDKHFKSFITKTDDSNASMVFVWLAIVIIGLILTFIAAVMIPSRPSSFSRLIED